MKRKLRKNNNFAIYNFPYYKKNRGFLRMFVAKALLAFITCFYGAGYFSEMLNLADEAVAASFTAGFICLVYTMLFGLFGRRYVLTVTMASAVIFVKPLGEWGKDFIYHVLTVADGSIIDADKLLKDADKVDPLPFLLVLSAAFGMLFAFCSHHRFSPELILTYFAIMIIPSFLSQHTSYTPGLGVFIAGMAAMWCSSLAFSASYSLASGGVTGVSLMDRQYRDSVRKASPINRIKSDNIHFNKFFSDSAVIFISVLLTVSITAACFPLEGDLKLDRVIQKISDSVKSVGEWGSGIIRNINAAPYKGFFSADGGSINISNGINPNDTPQSNTRVLEVFTQYKDKLYLRGDIGYSFDGRQWRSVSEIDFDDISYYVTDYGSGGQVSMRDVLASYTPEIEPYLANMMMETDEEYVEQRLQYDTGISSKPLNFFAAQNVKINYLQKMNTVLFAGTPLIYTFRENGNYSVKGDFIALADRGRINSMETLVLYYPLETVRNTLESFFIKSYDIDDCGNEIFDALPVSKEEYKTYLNAYERFVYEYYTAVPDDELRTVADFSDVLKNDTLGSSFFNYDYMTSLASADMYQRESFARCLEEYFTEGKYGYKYSLKADNFSGEDTPLYNFLFNTKEGHCAMYASAMCLMLRHCGVPARYVTGFTVGGENFTVTNEGLKYTVLQKNLHAWVEVYYDDVGWVPYDPTPGGGMSAYAPIGSTVTTTEATTADPPETSTRTTSSTTTATTTAEVEETTVKPSSSDSEDPFSGSGNGSGMSARDFLEVSLWIIGIPAAVILIIMSVRAVFISLNRKQSRKMKFFKSGDSRRAVKEMLEFSLRLLEINGIRRMKGETPEEFGFRADKTLKSGNVFRDAVPFYERSEFDNAPDFTDEEQLLVYGSVTKLLKITLDKMGGIKRFVTRVKLFGKNK